MCILGPARKSGMKEVFVLLSSLTPPIALFIFPGATFESLQPVLSRFSGTLDSGEPLGLSNSSLLGQSPSQDISNSGIIMIFLDTKIYTLIARTLKANIK